MTVTSPNQWTRNASSSIDVEIPCGPTSGNWLIAVVAWSVTDGSSQTCTIGDVHTNLWQLLYSGTSPAAVTNIGPANPTLGQQEIQNVQIWACPIVHYAGWPLVDVYAAFTNILEADVGSVAINMFELAGMGNGSITVDSVTTATASSATSLTINAPTPAADCVFVAAANTDLNSATQNFTPPGWNVLTQVSQNKIVATNWYNPDLRLMAAWIESNAAQTAIWSSSAACNWAGVVVAFRQTGIAPSQPNPAWPATQFQVGFGATASTPASAVSWTNVPNRLLEWSHTRGVPYDLGKAQSEPTDMLLKNDDGAFTPRPAGSATANTVGTTTTLVCAATAVSGVNVSDFFQLYNSSGVLKEQTIFQVTGVATVGGTTTITFVRADLTGTGAAVATASGDVFAGVPVDLWTPYRILMTWQGKTYVSVSGVFGDLGQQWQNPNWGEVPSVGNDALMPVAKAPADSPLRMLIYFRNPTHYWPLDDPQGSNVAQNLGSGSTQLAQVASKFGNGNGTAAFGASTQGLSPGTDNGNGSILGDDGSGWQVTGMTTANLNAKQGLALTGQGTDFPPVSGGVTLFGMLYVPAADWTAFTGGTNDWTIAIVRSGNPAGGSSTLIKVSVNRSSQVLQVTVWDKNTRVSTVTAGTLSFFPTSWTAWALTFNQGHWYLWQGGSLDASGTCNLGSSFNTIDIGGEADAYVTGFFGGGVHAHICAFPFMMDDQSILDLSVTIDFGYVTYGSLIAQQAIASAGWRGARVLPLSSLPTSMDQSPSGNYVDLADKAAANEDGLFFSDSAGQLQYRSHAYAAHQLPVATLGENATGGELPVLPEYGTKKHRYDMTFLYPAVVLSNTVPAQQGPQGSQSITSDVVAVNPAYADRYGPLTYTANTTLGDTWAAWLLAWWLLHAFQAPALTIDHVTMEPLSASGTVPAMWAFLLSIQPGDLVVVNHRPVGAPMISVTARVLQVQVTAIPHESYQVTLTLGAARPRVYVCNDPVLGIVGNSVIGM